ncbi:MAG: hypothetical protein Q9M94_06995 [Candidatus Gracilibacteria bacterium]|nr:hypothetical protein [Candidatus Gracilibacteria bacterium]MDQ7022382.1 hypothetical protein [Candidatus Gracilibacteria bacterium]
MKTLETNTEHSESNKASPLKSIITAVGLSAFALVSNGCDNVNSNSNSTIESGCNNPQSKCVDILPYTHTIEAQNEQEFIDIDYLDTYDVQITKHNATYNLVDNQQPVYYIENGKTYPVSFDKNTKMILSRNGFLIVENNDGSKQEFSISKNNSGGATFIVKAN